MDLIEEGFYDINLLPGTIFYEGLAAVEDSNSHLWGYINKEGKEVIPCKYKNASVFHEGLAAVQDPHSHLYGYINKEGKEVIPCKYKYADNFKEGLARVKDPHTNLYGYINKEGREVIPYKYVNASDFHEGLALVKTNNGQMIIDKNMNKIATSRRHYLKFNSIGRTITFNTKEELEHSKKEINLVLESAFEDNFVPILIKKMIKFNN